MLKNAELLKHSKIR